MAHIYDKFHLLQGFTINIKSLVVPGTHLISLGRMEGWVDHGATKRFCTQDTSFGNPALTTRSLAGW